MYTREPFCARLDVAYFFVYVDTAVHALFHCFVTFGVRLRVVNNIFVVVIFDKATLLCHVFLDKGESDI